MLKFVPYLVDLIIEGNSGDDLLIPALTTLANLCRSNPPVLSCLRNCGNNKVRFSLSFKHGPLVVSS